MFIASFVQLLSDDLDCVCILYSLFLGILIIHGDKARFKRANQGLRTLGQDCGPSGSTCRPYLRGIDRDARPITDHSAGWRGPRPAGNTVTTLDETSTVKLHTQPNK